MKKVVYFPETIHAMCSRDGRGLHMHPNVWWGVVEGNSPMNQGESVYVEAYELSSFNLIDGKPIYEFEDDTEWKPLPKKWTFEEDLLVLSKRMSEDPRKEKAHSVLQGLKYTDPNDLLYGIEQGFFVPSWQNHAEVKAEVDKSKKQYRIVRHYPPWTMTYGQPLSSRTRLRSEVFDAYADAYFTAEQKCLDWAAKINSNIALERADTIHWVLSKVPKSQYDECRYIIQNLYFGLDSEFRVYNEHVLYRRDRDTPWKAVFQIARDGLQSTK